MMLVEEGKLHARCAGGAATSRPSPTCKVGVEKTDANGSKSLELVAPRRPMTVQDLLRHTSGLTYGFFGKALVKKAYASAAIAAEASRPTPSSPRRIAKLPLAYQPGSTWDYSNSHRRARPRARGGVGPEPGRSS